MSGPSWPLEPPRNPKRGTTTSKTLSAPHWQRDVPQDIKQKNLTHLEIVIMNQSHSHELYPLSISSQANQCPVAHTRSTPKVDERPIAPKADHLVKVMGSHRHLSVSNVEGVDSFPPPFSHALLQNDIGRGL